MIFDIGALLAPGAGGYTMMEVILPPGAINTEQPCTYTLPNPQFYTMARSCWATPGKLDDSTGSQTVVYDGQNVPKVGLLKIDPQAVRQGDVFYVQLALFDYSDIPLLQNGNAEITMQAGGNSHCTASQTKNGSELPFTSTATLSGIGKSWRPIRGRNHGYRPESHCGNAGHEQLRTTRLS